MALVAGAGRRCTYTVCTTVEHKEDWMGLCLHDVGVHAVALAVVVVVRRSLR